MKDKIERYIAWKATYTTRACINYKPWLLKFQEYTKKPIEKITIEDIVKFRKYLDSHYGTYSIQFAFVVLQNFFKFWKLQGIECLSPVLIKIPSTLQKSYNAISEEEYKKLINASYGDDFINTRNRLLVHVLWETGIRVSELIDLDTTDVVPERCGAIIRTKKSSRRRQIFWSKETHKLLLEYLPERAKVSHTPALFVGAGTYVTKRITPRQVQRIIKMLCIKEGIRKRISPHSFRHGKAHYILDKGGNPRHVGAILGHSEKNPGASFIYLQFNNKELEKIAQTFLPKRD